ncbi:trypsin-like serine peptidase [Pseudonocardia nigra]|uniref:trypsin-like serine peptidase n=1 Tax=Pseudonocardia nigra TaxID=1921578 RepID=UPI001C5F687A|nr:trypsin-like peptidase domain-containing protein [Pseudonocardia nigra]
MAASTVGQLLGPGSSCTATVVASDSGRVAVTAAHCVYIPRRHDRFAGGFRGRPPGWITDLAFYPGRAGKEAPYGKWNVDHMWIDQRWQDSGDPHFDVAFLRLADLDGRTAEHTLGAQGIAFATTRISSSSVTMLGYPVEPPFDGTTLRRCTGSAVDTPGSTSSDALGMECRMTAGSSGGPWLIAFAPERGSGTVIAATSYQGLDGRRTYGIPLGTSARHLYETADHTTTDPAAHV